jgi:hypothetical protein
MLASPAMSQAEPARTGAAILRRCPRAAGKRGPGDARGVEPTNPTAVFQRAP